MAKLTKLQPCFAAVELISRLRTRGYDVTPLAAPAQPLQAGVWQPIETAPKDGTLVDLWDQGRLADCSWGMETPNGFSDGASEPGWLQRECDISGTWHLAIATTSPTHWMPLPAHPALSQLPGEGG